MTEFNTGDFRLRDAREGAVVGTQRVRTAHSPKVTEVLWNWNSLTGKDCQGIPVGDGEGGRDVLSLRLNRGGLANCRGPSAAAR